MKKILSIVMAVMALMLTFAACALATDNLPVDVTGLWVAYLTEGESELFLRDDGTGSLRVGESAYTVSWMQQNGMITLDQGGALVAGVYDEVSISLAIGGGNLIFLRELPEVQPLDSDLTGQWIARMPGSDSLLTLNADGTATLQIGPDAMPLTWTHDGAAVTLWQDGFPVECTYDGVFISIFLGDGSMCFMPVAAEEAAQ